MNMLYLDSFIFALKLVSSNIVVFVDVYFIIIVFIIVFGWTEERAIKS